MEHTCAKVLRLVESIQNKAENFTKLLDDMESNVVSTGEAKRTINLLPVEAREMINEVSRPFTESYVNAGIEKLEALIDEPGADLPKFAEQLAGAWTDRAMGFREKLLEKGVDSMVYSRRTQRSLERAQ